MALITKMTMDSIKQPGPDNTLMLKINDVAGRLSGTGDAQLGGAADSLGFYGTTPIAKQTGVAVTVGAVHAALVALGLIGV